MGRPSCPTRLFDVSFLERCFVQHRSDFVGRLWLAELALWTCRANKAMDLEEHFSQQNLGSTFRWQELSWPIRHFDCKQAALWLYADSQWHDSETRVGNRSKTDLSCWMPLNTLPLRCMHEKEDWCYSKLSLSSHHYREQAWWGQLMRIRPDCRLKDGGDITLVYFLEPSGNEKMKSIKDWTGHLSWYLTGLVRWGSR